VPDLGKRAPVSPAFGLLLGNCGAASLQAARRSPNPVGKSFSNRSYHNSWLSVAGPLALRWSMKSKGKSMAAQCLLLRRLGLEVGVARKRPASQSTSTYQIRQT
jgi:hypothetical protein